MDQRGKKMVLLALSRGNQNSVKVQASASNTTTIEQHVQPLEPNNSESHHENSENQATPANSGETITTNTDQDNTTLENNSSPSILADTNGSNELDDMNDFTTGDFSGTDSGDEYRLDHRARSSSSSSSTSSSSNSSSSSSSSDSADENINSNNANLVHELNQPVQPILKPRGRKRTRDPTTWKKNVAKRLKNNGQTYISVESKKKIIGKTMAPTCTSKCRLACASKFSEQGRVEIFQSYWKLGSVERQRGFLNACTRTLNCAYRRIKTNKAYDRKPNTAYYLLNDNKEIRVCKTFLVNTLGITQRIIRTVIDGKAQNDGFIPLDRRGKHGKQCKLNPEVIQAVKDHIESIPKIESHYLRASTSRVFIDGGLTVAELHRNYCEIQKQQNKPTVNYDAYSRIFNQDFNIGFFKPKKDRCDECEAYENASEEEKNKLRDSFKLHQEEKSLSRLEKDRDMKKCHEPDTNTIVFTYDLQAVLPCPVGKSSSFFYKSRLNCYNLTMSNANKQETTCYFWHEGLGNRGAIEIGSCVYKYLEQIAFENPSCNIIIYSDNCCGQQKNRFVFAMYYYAVSKLNINSIQHNFLIRGHTQNEGDAAHSVIEKSVTRAKNAGPIYVPDQYISLIRGAKKTGKPFVVKEMNYDDFFDLKSLEENMNFNIAKNVHGDVIKTGDIKSIKFTKSCEKYQYRTSYKTENWEEVKAILKPKERNLRRNRDNVCFVYPSIDDIPLKQAYTSKIKITERKKRDLLQLVQANIVPSYYGSFYNDLI